MRGVMVVMLLGIWSCDLCANRRACTFLPFHSVHYKGHPPRSARRYLGPKALVILLAKLDSLAAAGRIRKNERQADAFIYLRNT
eukprot:scaffold23577_cov84-Skeletonema_dohrnii-CCMP3373.AAC.1